MGGEGVARDARYGEAAFGAHEPTRGLARRANPCERIPTDRAHRQASHEREGPENTFPPIPQLRLVQGRRNAALWASRFADSEVGRMGRVRRVGQWFLEICFESFAQDLATPSARSFAHGIPHEMIEASFMREALRHFLLENQMSHVSHVLV